MKDKELSSSEAMDMFRDSGALLEGHFLLTSGRHSNQYMQCAKVLQYPGYASRLGEELARRYLDQGVQVVIGPATGGIIVAQEVARALGGKVRSLFAEREEGKMNLRRGFSIEPGEKVLVVEDVITTGGSVQEVIGLVQRLGGDVVGVGVLVDRSGGNVEFESHLESVMKMHIVSYLPDDCPLCGSGMPPAVKPGSRNL